MSENIPALIAEARLTAKSIRREGVEFMRSAVIADDYDRFADALESLSAPPATDTDRGAWDKAFPKVDGDVLGISNLPSPWDAFVAGRASRASQPVQVEVTNEMVERAADAIERTWAGGGHPNATRQEFNRARARAALTAALGGEE